MQVPNLSLLSRLIALVIPFLLVGCSGEYVASPRYVPMNEKKGDVNVNISLTGAQLGYAFSNRFSAFATGVATKHEGQPFIGSKDGDPKRSDESEEINLGLTFFGGKGKFRYEVVAGGGMGDMAFSSSKSNPSYSLDMYADKWNVYVQPNFSFKISERVDQHLAIALFAKFNSVNYYNTTVTGEVIDRSNREMRKIQVADLSPYPGYDYDDGLVYFSNHEKSNLFFIEPGIFVKAGTKYFKGLIQLSYVSNDGGPALYYQPYSITLGAAINFNVFDLKSAAQPKKK
jgi:hypothetical protein